MYKIYIDTTQRKEKKVKLVTVGDSNETVLEEVCGEIDVISTVNRVLKKHGLQPKDIEQFVPNVGPGSFTGIKAGVTIANVLNWASGKKGANVVFKPVYGGEPNIG